MAEVLRLRSRLGRVAMNPNAGQGDAFCRSALRNELGGAALHHPPGATGELLPDGDAGPAAAARAARRAGRVQPLDIPAQCPGRSAFLVLEGRSW